MRIDVIIESDKSAQQFSRLGLLAEEYGLGAIWIANNANGRDAFVNFTPLALQSRSIRMGPIAVSPFELHPLKMAISLLSFNEIAKGRAQIVVGGGGGTAEAMNCKPHRMVRAMRECIEILNMASAGAAGRYAGDIYPINWMDTRWVTQPKPMIYAGANGPQMLKAAAGYADGIMVSDFTPARVMQVRKLIDPIVQQAGKQPDRYPLNNFWAWHVKERAEDAYREARIWLCVRGTIYPDYIHDVVDESEASIVIEHLSSFRNAYYRRTPDIEGVPDEIVSKIVSRGTSATSIDNIEAEVRRFQEFERAGLSQIALKVYGEPEAAIRTIGEHIVPALSSTRD